MGIQSCIARSHVMRTVGVSTSANTHSPSLKIFLNMSGTIFLTRYRNPHTWFEPNNYYLSTTQTKTIWLKFFGDTLHGNRSLARIALRASLGKEPTEAQIMARWESIKAPAARKALAEKLQTNIRRAFDRGEEV